MSRRRLALKLAACALAGAALTVAVAWGCVLWHSEAVHVDIVKGTHWPAWAPSRWPLPPDTLLTSESHGSRVAILMVGRAEPEWQMFWEAIASDSGWPALGMRSRTSVHRTERHTARRYTRDIRSNGLVIPDEGIPYLPEERMTINLHVLPLRPLWPGFALNTAVYGTIIFVLWSALAALWSAPGLVRRRVRKRRGRCIGCGYNLRGRGSAGGPCPECGA
jgi:hypothetical protein